jgi:glycine/D-amino acid oxidase-like deaminating enzyme
MSEPASVLRLGGEELRYPPSLWAATGAEPPATEPLCAKVEADVAIVGGGFTGLSAGLHLAEKGFSVVVVEAAEIGWGASGRNNGQVIPGLKLDPDDVEARFGREVGGRMVEWAGKAPAYVFDLIERHGIACDAVNKGWIQPAYTQGAIRTIESRCRQWAERGAPVEMLDPKDLPGLLGTPAFSAAWLDRRGGCIQPLSYSRGLAKAAQKAGVAVHTRSFVRSLERKAGRWVVECAQGSVTAVSVIVATNAYSGNLVPGLSRTIVPVRTAQVATKPLSDNVRSTILPKGHVASDTRRLLTSFRLSPDGRLVMGGSGATGGAHRTSLEHHLHRSAKELFGHLGTLEWEFGWSGYLAVTTDHFPHVHEPAEGMHVALGCNGRGIGLMTSIGLLLAERIGGTDPKDLPIPVSPLKPVTFHAFRNIGVALATSAKRVQDSVDRRRG